MTNLWPVQADNRLSLPAPPDSLIPDTFAGRLFDAMAPLGQYDPDNQWSLLTYCNAIGTMFQLVEDWVRDTEDGPGWSSLLDLERCPPEALAWLAQFVGVRLLPGATDADSRERIGNTDGFNRGTVAALRAACWNTLTGSRSVFLWERDGDPAQVPEYAYHLTVVTYADQTPDPVATRKALLAQKPGGLVLDYVVISGQTYQQVADRFDTYADVKAAYRTYGEMAADEPA